MRNEDIDELAGDVIAVIGRDADFFRNATADDIGELLHNIARATDPAAEELDHAWTAWRTDDWYRHVADDDRERIVQEIKRRLEHERTAGFVSRWKGMDLPG